MGPFFCRLRDRERFEAKHAPGLDPGNTGSRRKNATKQNMERDRDSIRCDRAPCLLLGGNVGPAGNDNLFLMSQKS
jgi:hypothetical protein